jgi:hypothetical protein
MFAVAHAIRREDPMMPLVLAGDNVYPDKNKETGSKRYSVQRLYDGLDCLNPTERRGGIYATLGNHNIADPAILEAELFYSKWFLPNPFYAVIFSNKRALVFLDSNLIEAGDAETMLAWLRKTIQYLESQHVREYWLIMHHPIVSFKKKSIYTLKNHEALLDVLVSAPIQPVAILVGDTHNYQKGHIYYEGRRFLQVVSGTGGADLDSLDILNGPEGEGGAATFSEKGTYLLMEAEANFGYQRVGATDNEGRIEWISVASINMPSSHTRRRSRRSRRRRCTGGQNSTRRLFEPQTVRSAFRKPPMYSTAEVVSHIVSSNETTPVYATTPVYGNRPRKNMKRYSHNMNSVRTSNSKLPERSVASVSPPPTAYETIPLNFTQQMKRNTMYM